MKRIHILTGKTGSGKTTGLREWVNKYKHYVPVSGLLSPVINGKRFFEDVSSGELFPMESADTDAVKVGRYSFSPDAFNKAGSILNKSLTGKDQWVIVDEFGKLELENKGLDPFISPLIKSQDDTNLLLVIRESLVNDFLKKYSLSDKDFRYFSFQNPAVPAWILAGGMNKRMGKVKALLKFGEETLIERLIKQLNKYFTEVNIISNDPEKYSFTGLNVYEDIIRGHGPLSGIHSVLKNSAHYSNVILSSDMPLIPDDLFRYLSDNFDKGMLLFREDKYIEPFPGLYTKEALSMLESHFLTNTGKSIYEVLSSSGNLKLLNALECDFYKPGIFLNMNTPADYEKVLEILKV
jgi:molybdenum cofactor guanylyltransferase